MCGQATAHQGEGKKERQRGQGCAATGKFFQDTHEPGAIAAAKREMSSLCEGPGGQRVRVKVDIFERSRRTPGMAGKEIFLRRLKAYNFRWAGRRAGTGVVGGLAARVSSPTGTDDRDKKEKKRRIIALFFSDEKGTQVPRDTNVNLEKRSILHIKYLRNEGRKKGKYSKELRQTNQIFHSIFLKHKENSIKRKGREASPLGKSASLNVRRRVGERPKNVVGGGKI